MTLTLKQYDIADTITRHFDAIEKIDAIKFIKSIYGTAAELKDIVTAYNSIEWDYVESN